jgi:hypothetical protein
MFAVFDTYIKGDFEKAVKKMEKRINEKVPELKLIAPGLSIKVQGMKGPILEEELPKCKEFGKKIATQLKTWPVSLFHSLPLCRDLTHIQRVNLYIESQTLQTPLYNPPTLPPHFLL